MNMLLIQFIGAIGYTLLTFSYFKKSKSQILLLQIFSYIFFTTHYYLLSGVTGAICNLISLAALIAIYVFDLFDFKFKKVLAMFFIILLIVINVMTFQNIFSLFPMIASVIAILSFLLDDENSIRCIGIIATICWLVYAIVYKSYISIIYEVITLIGVCIAYLKNRKNTIK